jgi:CheY-like chemotaxis protein
MTRPTLLCVDDDATVRELYRVLLGSYGYEVIVAENGWKALRLFDPNQIDAVILDYEMPGLRGSEVAAEIKRRNPDVPVVMMSGCASVVEDAPRFVDAAVAKGAPVGCLVDKVSTLLHGAAVS